MMRALVCGGRDYEDGAALNRALNAVHSKRSISLVIEGGARGADQLAKLWAEWNEIDVLTFPADWGQHGRAAGPIRNRQMLEEGRPDIVVAFPGGKGTANMVRQAREFGVEVELVP